MHVSEVSVGDERRPNLLSEDPEVTELVACFVCWLWVYRF
jgi:hypothetical protein